MLGCGTRPRPNTSRSSMRVNEMHGMRAGRSLVAAVLALVVLATPAVVLADGRVALVVGNSTYDHIGRLPNPENDAADMSVALRRLGFEVTTELDADRVVLTEALRAFTRRSAGADVSLVFYAGHGIEMDGVNYLLPVDARLERDVDVRYETVTLDDLLVSTSGASLRLVILDACRNNPLARSMRRTSASRSVSDGSLGDLKDDLLGDETLVAYAAAAGTTAADGRGRNSPYTAALLANLEQPLEIGLLFRRVRAQVLASTNGEQRSHEYHSLVGEHYLSGAPPAAASVSADAVAAAPAPDAVPAPEPGPAPVSAAPLAVPAAQQPASASQASAAPTAAAELEGLFWQSILNSANPAEFEAYLQRFPNGVFSELAQARLVALRAPLDDAFSATAPDSTVATEPGTVFRDCDECPEMVVMAGGGLALGRYEVTVGEYRAFTVATGGAAGARCAFNDEFSVACPRLSANGASSGDVRQLGRRPGVFVVAEPDDGREVSVADRGPNGNGRLSGLSRDVSRSGRGTRERAQSAPTAPTPPVCRTWSGICRSGRRIVRETIAAIACCAAVPGSAVRKTSIPAVPLGSSKALRTTSSVFV